MSDPRIVFELLPGGRAPKKAHLSDSCWDAYANERVYIAPGHTAVVWLGVCVELPSGWGLQIRPRSGLSREGLLVALGTIDEGYRGQLGAVVQNLDSDPFVVRSGDRIAQIFVEKIHPAEWVEGVVHYGTDRGTNGGGSTGV